VGVTGAWISTYWLQWPVVGIWGAFIAGGFGALFLSAWYVRRYLWQTVHAAKQL
jgi:Na+-driven multidrug efflux pump